MKLITTCHELTKIQPASNLQYLSAKSHIVLYRGFNMAGHLPARSYPGLGSGVKTENAGNLGRGGGVTSQLLN